MEREENRDEPISRAIMLAAAAGACRLFAETVPDAAPGMLKAADSYSDQAAGLLKTWADKQ